MNRSTPEVSSFDVAIGSHNGCQTGDGAGNGCTGQASSAGTAGAPGGEVVPALGPQWQAIVSHPEHLCS